MAVSNPSLIVFPVQSARVSPPPIIIMPPRPDFARRYHDGRGKYRVFNAAEYRFYRSNSGPPAETDTPFATNATLPYEPADVYADGTWYVSVSYFNGVIDSGFLPVGPNGETCLRLDIAGGEETNSPPQDPNVMTLEARAGGVVRVNAAYYEEGSLRADEWSIGYAITAPGPPPGCKAIDNPDFTVAFKSDQGLEILSYDLPAQIHGRNVAVTLQTRRNDGTVGAPVWVYSEGTAWFCVHVAADAEGPTAPEGLESWPGRLPEDV